MTAVEALDPTAAGALAEVHATAFDRPWSASDIADMIRGLSARVLAVRGDGAILGFILLQAAAGEAEILTLAVRPEARRRRIGARLVEAAAAVATAAGAQAMWLDVAADNAAALALYAGAGFQPNGRRRGYYPGEGGRRIDAVVMRRSLASGA